MALFDNLPQIKSAQSGAAILKLVLFSLLAFAVVWFFFIRPEAAQQDAADARMDAAQAEAMTEAAEETVRIVVEHQRTIETITQTTENNSHEILNTPGAEQSIDPALHDAGLRALCLHDNRSSAECGPVLYPDDGQHGPDGRHAARQLAE